MAPIDPHIRDLFQKYLDGNTTKQELEELLRYFDLTAHTEQLQGLILAQFEKEAPSNISEQRLDHIAQRVDDTVLHHIQSKDKVSPIYKWIISVSAAAILIIPIMIFLNKEQDTPIKIAGQSEEIQPGSNRATLTIDNGESIQLSEQQEILLNKGDTIGYENGESILVSGTVQWATLSTPRAGQYQMVLDDGTKVWLNAASQIKYPTRFTSNERKVSITGEAYFEVVPDRDKPFVVETEHQTVRVLGTKFNIEAYPGTDVQSTTLVEGRVQIETENMGNTRILRPGQQAKTISGTTSILEIDPSDYIAWTEGLIMLNSLDLNQVLRQLERWYDVEFGSIPASLGKKKVFGSLKRNLPLGDVLPALESNYDVKFIIKGRRIEVAGR